jgi:hypothetical protein
LTILGVDYAWGRPQPALIAAAGYRFALRYLSNDSGKNLSESEAKALLAAGLDIGVVWETTANRALSGAAGGTADGTRAKAQADICGAPPGSAIYFAVDFDAQPNHMPTIDAYAAAFAAAIAPHPAGVYGGLAVCNRLTRLTYRWQTAAWSHGWRSPGVCLYQRIGQALIDGVGCDVNEQLAPFGGWLAAPPSAAHGGPVFSEVTVDMSVLHSAFYPPPELNAKGEGWYPDPLPIPFAKIAGQPIIQGSNPETDGSVWASAQVMMQDRDGGTKVTYRKLSDGVTPGFTVRWFD